MKTCFFTVRIVFFLCTFYFGSTVLYAWGFYAHQEINRLSVFTLPPEMIGFYKKNISYLSRNAVTPDKRRYAFAEEACRHYIDLDHYPDSLRRHMPKFWHEAIQLFTEDTLNKYGIVPWHIYLLKLKLTDAFKTKDYKQILKLSADIGHYISDSNVPLHTTENYNGQRTNQHGIHGFWESRLPELFSNDYNFFVGQARYLNDVQASVWDGIYRANDALDSVLIFEQVLNSRFPPESKYAIEERNGVEVKVYSFDYAAAYHAMLKDQVERQMIASVRMVGAIWYTAWADAGQPELIEGILVPALPELTKEHELPQANSSSLTDRCNH